MKAKDLKNTSLKLELEGKEYEINFDMNTFCELEDIYGNIQKAFDDLQSMKIKAIRALLYAALKVENESLTLKQVGKMINVGNMNDITRKIGELLKTSMPEKDENEGLGE